MRRQVHNTQGGFFMKCTGSFHRFEKRFVRTVALFLAALSLFWATDANAHAFIIKPVQSTVQVGAATDIWVTLSEPFAKPDLSMYGYRHEIDAKMVYANGESSPITNFSYYDTVRQSGANPASSDIQKTSATVAAKGTVMLTAKLQFSFDGGPYTFIGFAKNAMNLESDGAAQKAIGGSDVLEIVPMQDMNFIVAGKPFKVKVLFKGQPLAGCEVGAAWNGTPALPDGEQDFPVTAKTDANGIATLTPDRPSLWLISAGTQDKEGVYYGGTLLLFANAEEFEEDTASRYMSPAANVAGIQFSEFPAGSVPEADDFLANNNLRWASSTATGTGSSSLYTGGKNQLPGESGFRFTVPTTTTSGADVFTGFMSVYELSAASIGQATFDALAEVLKKEPVISEGGMNFTVPDIKTLFPSLGLHFFQIYDNGTERDVTSVMMAGMEVSGIDQGVVNMFWGALLVDRDVVNGVISQPIDISSVGEYGAMLYDGKHDGNLSGTFYFAKKSSVTDDDDGSSGCDAGFGIGALVLGLAALVARRGK